jgi:SRSO17 transposase
VGRRAHLLARPRRLYTPASRLPKGRTDPAFQTKPHLAIDLLQAARQAGIGFRAAVVAACFYGDNPGFTEALGRASVAYLLAVKPRKGAWHWPTSCTPQEAARQLAWGGPQEPGTGPQPPGILDGHAETW